MNEFIMHEDHGHAWLEVPAELAERILGDNISGFSYISDDCETVYLEEDCDATAFIEKLNDKQINHVIKEQWHEENCFVRSLSNVLHVNDNEQANLIENLEQTAFSKLTDSQAKFAVWLTEKMPYLLSLFDFEDRIYLDDKVEEYLSIGSSGETVLARFVLSVWRGDNQYDFDVTEAVRTLDKAKMKIVTDWLSNPFWP